MISIRKFVYAALLAAATLNIAPTVASAEEPAHGKFTLTHDVRWGTAKIPAGDYQFSYNAGGVSPVVILSKISGTPAGYMVMVQATEDVNTASGSRLMLETTADGSYVTAMQLPEFGMTLHFTVPPHGTQRQLAKAGAGTSAGQ